MRDISNNSDAISAIFDHYEVEDKEHPVYTKSLQEDEDEFDLMDIEIEIEVYEDDDSSITNDKYSDINEENTEIPEREKLQEYNERRKQPRMSSEKRPPQKRNRKESYSDFEDERPRRKKTTKKSRKKKITKKRRRPSPKGNTKYVDKRTGIEYEVLPGSSREAVKAFKSGGLTSMDDMMRFTEMAEGFDGFDLSASASRFMPHMQVPISDKERKAALRKVQVQKAKDEEVQKREEMQAMQQQNKEIDVDKLPQKRRRRRK